MLPRRWWKCASGASTQSSPTKKSVLVYQPGMKSDLVPTTVTLSASPVSGLGPGSP